MFCVPVRQAAILIERDTLMEFCQCCAYMADKGAESLMYTRRTVDCLVSKNISNDIFLISSWISWKEGSIAVLSALGPQRKTSCSADELIIWRLTSLMIVSSNKEGLSFRGMKGSLKSKGQTRQFSSLNPIKDSTFGNCAGREWGVLVSWGAKASQSRLNPILACVEPHGTAHWSSAIRLYWRIFLTMHCKLSRLEICCEESNGWIVTFPLSSRIEMSVGIALMKLSLISW